MRTASWTTYEQDRFPVHVHAAPNPTDRGRPGTRRHLVTDRNGLPLAFALTGANTYDSVPFKELPDSIPPIGGQPGRARRHPESSTPTRPTTADAADRPAAVAGSRPASPAMASRPARSWASQAGHRAHLRLDQPLPQARHTLRAQKRHPSCPYRSRVLTHPLQRAARRV